MQGRTYSARFWYDGQQLNNAKNDAAEVACMEMNRVHCTAANYQSSPTNTSSGYGYSQSQGWGGH